MEIQVLLLQQSKQSHRLGSSYKHNFLQENEKKNLTIESILIESIIVSCKTGKKFKSFVGLSNEFAHFETNNEQNFDTKFEFSLFR